MNSTKKRIPDNIVIPRGQTQKNVNKILLEKLINQFDRETSKSILDLPCGNLEFLSYVKQLFPNWDLKGADLFVPKATQDMNFIQMDLSKDFSLLKNEKFDIISSISGIMMFGNTSSFIESCISHLKPEGTLIVTNDNPATIKDRLSYLLLGRFRIFDQIFDDKETMTQLVLIQDLTRTLRINGIKINDITYCSFYPKDFIFLPFALMAYPFQMLYLLSRKKGLSNALKTSLYNFKQLFARHYIIIGTKSA
jgi:SAM-dependent methyltransferase